MKKFILLLALFTLLPMQALAADHELPQIDTGQYETGLRSDPLPVIRHTPRRVRPGALPILRDQQKEMEGYREGPPELPESVPDGRRRREYAKPCGSHSSRCGPLHG